MNEDTNELVKEILLYNTFNRYLSSSKKLVYQKPLYLI